MLELDLNPQDSLGPVAGNSAGDRYLYQVNRNTFDKLGSEAFFNRHFGKLFGKTDSLFLVIGTDSGLLPKHVMNKGLPDGSRCLFVELPEVLERLRQEDMLPPPEDKIVCITHEELYNYHKAFQFREYFYLNSVRLIQSVGAQDAFLPEYRELYWNVENEFQKLSNLVNASIGNEIFTATMIQNITENRISSIFLKNLFEGKSAVVLAGGPSLDEILPWIKKNREHLTILAVSRISRRLQEMEVIPDLIFTIDPTALSFDVSKEMLKFDDRPILVHIYHATPRLVGQWLGHSAYAGPRFPWGTPLNIPTLPATGPNVTNFALHSAIEMGFSQIILGGLDLCFRRDGVNYAQGSNEHRAGPRLDQLFVQVKTNGGWMADTTHNFARSVNTVAKQAELARRRDCRIINPAPSAAKISSVSHIPLEEIEIQPMNRPAREILHDAMPPDSAAGRCNYYSDILVRLRNVSNRLNRIRRLAGWGMKANNGLFGRKGMKADFRHKIKMDRIELLLNTKYRDLTNYLKKYGIRHFLQITRPDARPEWTDEEIEQTGRLYYKAYLNSAHKLYTLLKKAEERLEARLEEEKEDPDFELLFNQWRRDRQPGRARIWRARNPEKYAVLPEEIREQFEDLDTKFHRILNKKETGHMKVCRKRADVKKAKDNARILFKRREKERLERLVQALAHHSSPAAGLLTRLINGYIAELGGDPRQALAEYHPLVECNELGLTEEALRRILQLSFNHGDPREGLLALECLAAISVQYMVPYADLLILLGDTNKGLDVYADYLEKIPNDTMAMFRLGEHYKKLGFPDAARLMFTEILNKEPDDTSSARSLAELEQS